MALLIDQLSGGAGGGERVHRASLEVAAGECLALVGPRGCGASLLLRLLAGEARASQGRAFLGGRRLEGPPGSRPLRRVDLAAPLPARRSLAELLGPAALREGLAELLGLSGMEREPLGRLAPAMGPRAALAIALAGRPAALLLDEPGRGLAPADRAELYELIGAARRQLGLCVLAATGEPEAAFALADRVAVMHGGRVLEAGSAREIYLRPQTDVGAAALGPVNLLVGSCTDDGVRLGPFVFATRPGGPGEGPARVQLMFRPEDVELAAAPAALAGTPLGRAEVAGLRYAGAVEGLRLRLPPIPGVRVVAPAPPFGEAGLLLAAARPAEQARRAPLRPGDAVWTAVRRFHALPHPGLHLAAVGPESPAARRLAELAAARLSAVTPTDGAPEAALARLHLRQPCDLAVIAARAPGAAALLARLLERSEQHLLLLDELRDPPASGLICVAGHEGDKATVQFAGRLLRHLGAAAALLTVLPDGAAAPPERVARFHAAARETLGALGVPARSLFRAGEAAAAIIAERRGGGHGLIAVGGPPPRRRGLSTLDLLAREAAPAALLVVRPPGLAPAEERLPGLVAGLLQGAEYH